LNAYVKSLLCGIKKPVQIRVIPDDTPAKPDYPRLAAGKQRGIRNGARPGADGEALKTTCSSLRDITQSAFF
jgi:hypothetical protein